MRVSELFSMFGASNTLSFKIFAFLNLFSCIFDPLFPPMAIWVGVTSASIGKMFLMIFRCPLGGFIYKFGTVSPIIFLATLLKKVSFRFPVSSFSGFDPQSFLFVHHGSSCLAAYSKHRYVVRILVAILVPVTARIAVISSS